MHVYNLYREVAAAARSLLDMENASMALSTEGELPYAVCLELQRRVLDEDIVGSEAIVVTSDNVHDTPDQGESV